MKIHPNISEPDSFYAALVDVHHGLGSGESAELNARLLFLLANQIGDHDVLLACLHAARNFLSPHH
ncbi:hypothetical protein P3T40_007347 [Paraburkholderia sp. EB58]|jgi:hypothetical protein|uniref:DUF2783 domain-containing protein n=1 Tax=Paraburkholderia sp. EB58 TaxID=3035125 RepID=UPI003D217DE9